ncbi:MAG TPA: hypothetical protein VMO78_16980 [Rhizomicrobium sp.]|nr:hypothetical protein [Rhizomicrobium sp.]
MSEKLVKDGSISVCCSRSDRSFVVILKFLFSAASSCNALRIISCSALPQFMITDRKPRISMKATSRGEGWRFSSLPFSSSSLRQMGTLLATKPPALGIVEGFQRDGFGPNRNRASEHDKTSPAAG